MFYAFMSDYLLNLCFLFFLKFTLWFLVLGDVGLYLTDLNDSLSSTLHDAFEMVRNTDSILDSDMKNFLINLLPLVRDFYSNILAIDIKFNKIYKKEFKVVAHLIIIISHFIIIIVRMKIVINLWGSNSWKKTQLM